MADTVLTLTGIGIVPFAARGVTEDLNQITQGQSQRRTVNGELIDGSLTAFRKYTLSLSGGDVQPMAFDGVWVGQAVTVGCVTEFGAPITLVAGAATVVINRHPVTGSGWAVRVNGTDVRFATSVTFDEDAGVWSAIVDFGDAALTGAAHVFYRPELDCLVKAWSLNTDEYAAKPSWTMELEEV